MAPGPTLSEVHRCEQCRPLPAGQRGATEHPAAKVLAAGCCLFFGTFLEKQRRLQESSGGPRKLHQGVVSETQGSRSVVCAEIKQLRHLRKREGDLCRVTDQRSRAGSKAGFSLRKKLQQWAYRSILAKIEILAGRSGVEVVKVDLAYTSVIGRLKYAPQHLVDKDVAGAYVVGRRALGFEEKLPENYNLLLEDEEYLLYSLSALEEKVERLKRKLKGEQNQWKKKAVKKRLKEARGELKTLQRYLRALQSGGASLLPETQPTGGRSR